MGFQKTIVLIHDFSRRHLCLNPPALAGGRLRLKDGYVIDSAFSTPKEANA